MPVLFCGDFNSAPNSKIVQLVRSRGVSDNDGVWNESEYCCYFVCNNRYKSMIRSTGVIRSTGEQDEV